MHQLALRMKDFHALGFVHRDLKPGNVMWLPRENRWTVIDFGCAARTSEAAKLAFSPTYAAPEVIAAYRRGYNTIVAQVLPVLYSLVFLDRNIPDLLGLFVECLIEQSRRDCRTLGAPLCCCSTQ